MKNYSSFTKQEIIKAFVRLQLKIWLIIILFILGIAYISYGIYTIYINDYKFIFLFSGIGFITLSIGLIIIPYILAYKSNKIDDIDYELTFYDSYFDIVIKKGIERQESSIDYKDIYKKIKKGNYYFIYIDKIQAIIIKLNGFSDEDKIKFLELMRRI